MKTRDQFTMLKLDKSMRELQRGFLFSTAPKTPLQKRRSYDRRDHHHDENGGKGRVIENPFSLDCKAEPDAGKDQSDFAARDHANADRNPVQILSRAPNPHACFPTIAATVSTVASANTSMRNKLGKINF